MSFYSEHARQSQASPSVSLEKGAYRLRAPPKRSNPGLSSLRPRRESIANKDHPAIRYEKQMAVLVVFLICATMTCFGTAYYLFSTRWGFNPTAHSLSSDTNLAELQVVDFDLDLPSSSSTSGSGISGGARSTSEEKFLAYLPHSGFHNQRIAFENALVLSRLLNRTLLVPPVHLGSKSLFYAPFELLKQTLVLSDKRDLQNCQIATVRSSLDECADYDEYTHVPWDWLIDLSFIKDRQPLHPRWNFTDDWLQDSLGISKGDTFVLADTSRDMYGFQDFVSFSSIGTRKYQHMIHLSTLAFRKERLIQLGTLFGSSRLHFRNAQNLNMRKDIRSTMALINPLLENVASAVQQSLGKEYVGIHVRLGDGIFEENARSNSRLVWWKLVHGVLGYSIQETLAIERKILDSQESTAGLLSRPPMNLPVDWELCQFKLSAFSSTARVRPSPSCRQNTPLSSHMLPLHMPLFISTDALEPRHDPRLLRFVRAFPCVVFLSDFAEEIRPLDGLQSPLDGLRLRPFLLPFVDALVVARAERVVGTEGSTFSRFVEDVLWRVSHGHDIVQKG